MADNNDNNRLGQNKDAVQLIQLDILYLCLAFLLQYYWCVCVTPDKVAYKEWQKRLLTSEKVISLLKGKLL